MLSFIYSDASGKRQRMSLSDSESNRIQPMQKQSKNVRPGRRAHRAHRDN